MMFFSHSYMYIFIHFVSVNGDWLINSVMKLKPLFSFYYVESHWPPIDHGATVVMMLWYLDLQLPMQSVSITTNVVSSNPAHGELYSIQHYAINLRQVGGFHPVKSTNKTNCHDITEILLKVALNTITLTLTPIDHLSLTLDFYGTQDKGQINVREYQRTIKNKR